MSAFRGDMLLPWWCKQWIPLKHGSVVPNCVASNSRHSNLLDMNHLYLFFPYHNKRTCLNVSQAKFKELTSHFSTSSFVCHIVGTDRRKWSTALRWISVHNYTKFGILLITVIWRGKTWKTHTRTHTHTYMMMIL